MLFSAIVFMARKKAKNVHFVFKTHAPGERAMLRPLRRGTRTFVSEAGPGWPKKPKNKQILINFRSNRGYV